MADGGATIELRPQPGPQEAFLASPADIVIYGGAAGGGKSWALLLEPLRHIANPGFGAVIFRRESTQITNEGGLWDTAAKLYPPTGGQPRTTPKMLYRWLSGAKVGFGHLNAELSVLDWQGAQIALVCFDELTHFSRQQFFYMLSRNRSTCGVRPYVRATTNPDADSWVAEFISWWIDQDSGLPIAERCGKLRWFVRVDDQVRWADSAEELAELYQVPTTDAKSVTFIPASVMDNQILLAQDPGYLANLKALGRVERERLLGGNWKVRPAAGMYFRRAEAAIIDELPLEPEIVGWARGWDLAASEPTEDNPSPDWTAGVKLARLRDGRAVVVDVRRFRKRGGEVRRMVRLTADADGKPCRQRLPQDPGQAGKDQAETYVRELSGLTVKVRPVTGDKITRAEPVSSQWQRGQILLLRGPWNEEFLSELEAFPEGAHDDQVDALADAFDELPRAGSRVVAIRTSEVE